MGRLVEVVLSFALLCTVNCVENQRVGDVNYGYYNQNPTYYTQDPSLVNDASKQAPVVVSLPPGGSGYQVNEQYTPQYTVQASAQIPYTAQNNAYLQGVLPYSQPNQYSVNQPFQAFSQHQSAPQYNNLYVPFNQYQNTAADLNSEYSKIQTQPIPQPANHAPQEGVKVGAVQNTPLFNHHVYHPLHTNTQHDNTAPQVQQGLRHGNTLPQAQHGLRHGNTVPQAQQGLRHGNAVPQAQHGLRYGNTVPQAQHGLRHGNTVPQAQHGLRHGNQQVQRNPRIHQGPFQRAQFIQQNQQQNLSPPTPPRIYKNFRPIHPAAPPKPVPLNARGRKVEQKEEQEEEEQKEEVNDDEESEKQEDDEDHENQKEESAEEEEGFMRGKFSEDEDENERYEDDDHDESKLSSFEVPSALDKHNYYKNKHFSSPIHSDPDLRNYREFKEPKIEIKMYKYSKSSKPETIEGKSSENVPVIQHNKHSYKSQWLISSKMTSLTDE